MANHYTPTAIQRPRKWTEEIRAELREELENGATLQSIADRYGLSRQRIAQITGGVGKMRDWKKTYSIYPAIDSWMKYTHTTYTGLCETLGYSCSASAQVNLKRVLMGQNEPRKTVIDAILSVTGLTYEEAFKERKGKTE